MDRETPSTAQQRVRIAVARLLARENDRAPSTDAIHREVGPHGIARNEVEAILRDLQADGLLYQTARGWKMRTPPPGPDATASMALRSRILRH